MSSVWAVIVITEGHSHIQFRLYGTAESAEAAARELRRDYKDATVVVTRRNVY